MTTLSAITDVAGIRVGHAHNEAAITGCTVILCEAGAIGGIDRRGGATSTRQADGWEPWHSVETVHGVLLTGGSAFGLAASSGVMRYLEERKVGHGIGKAKVPIVASAALFDLLIGDGAVRPSPEMAYLACLNAGTNPPVEGSVGAGIGATVGKFRGLPFAMKAGIGTASVQVGQTDLVVGAIVAVNAFGDVLDPQTGQVLAGLRGDNGQILGSLPFLHHWATAGYPHPRTSENTVIGVVATNAKLSKMEATKVAQMAHDGLARVVRPAHLMFDGDTIFTLATGQVKSNVNVVGALAAEVFAEAMVRGTKVAVGMGGVPAFRDLS